MAHWPHIERFLTQVELCVGKRENETQHMVQEAIRSLPVRPQDVTIFEGHAPSVSSSQVRAAIREKRGIHGLLASVKAYATQEWLYL
jgi:nicotinic acid mononucleotide adenylyltransferase